MTMLTKEGAGVLSTVTRHLAFLDSEPVERAISTSSFDPVELRYPGTSVFVQITPELLEAQRGLVRCWMTTLVKAVSRGSEVEGEVLCLLDEASALGGLPALEEVLVRGRSSGARLLLAYQSDSQVTSAFKDKPTLIFDNCSTQIYLGGGINGYECAERLAKRIGDATILVESTSESLSRQQGGHGEGGGQVSHGRSWAEHGRPLMRPEEILVMSSDLLIAFVKDVPPVLAKRIKFFADALFGTAKDRKRMHPIGWVLLAIGVALCIAMLASR